MSAGNFICVDGMLLALSWRCHLLNLRIFRIEGVCVGGRGGGETEVSP